MAYRGLEVLVARLEDRWSSSSPAGLTRHSSLYSKRANRLMPEPETVCRQAMLLCGSVDCRPNYMMSSNSALQLFGKKQI
jgi:hypothetical protein